MKTSFRRSLLAAGGAVALAAITAVPASADSSYNLYGTWPNRLAHASFSSYGEVFTVHDDEGDGRSAVVYWKVGSQQGSCVNSKGKGTSKTCNLSFAEGRSIRWSLNVEDRSEPGGGHVVAGPFKYDTT